ncbi:hypothetical protein K9L16_03825, partial [Candidatus Pacearchaeota archaeon]|nr:hypothetical protein [Candidatus Pacearchaeota archaeon]
MKKDLDNALGFFKNKKIQNYFVFALIIGIIIFGFWIRIQNIPLLVDSTTGKEIPLALDPYYFLRGAETIVENNGELPEVDSMRKPFDVPWTQEILPQSSVLIWKIINIFSSEDVSVAYAHNLNPVIFFALGLIVYFLLIWFLTNSKLTALLSSFFLAIIPAYLYRTLAGFGDHEAIGMFAFFICLLSYGFLLKYLEKEKNKNVLWKGILSGAILGFLTNFVIISWGGVSKFIFMIFPASFLVFWLIKTQNNEFNKKTLRNLVGFYFTWLASTLIFAEIFGKGFMQVLNASLLVSSGLISLFVLGLIIVDFFVLWNLKKIKIKYIEKYRILFSVLGT